MLFRILAVGDVVGNPGLDFAAKNLRRIKKEVGADFVVVNGENANVVGVTPKQCDSLLAAGADAITLGNHTWTRWELQPYLDESPSVLRPANYAPQCPGRGAASFRTPFGPVLVVNLLGRFTLDPNTDSPFLTADALLEGTEAKMILVDFHAEATSEKLAMGYYLDGRAESVIGIKPEQSIGKFLGDVPRRYDCAPGPAKLEGAVFELDSETGACLKVEAVRYT